MSFADKVKKLVDEAPVASTGTNVNFGPTTFTPIVLKWNGRGAGAKPDKTPLAEYMAKHGLKEDDDIELEPGESLQLHIDIDITELNPSLDFHYERDIALVVSNKANKDPKKWILTSWSEIVQPSLEKVFGANWEQKIFPNGKKAAPVLYLAAEQKDPMEPVKEGKKSYSVPKFIGVYKDLDALRQAHDERYPPRDEAAEMEFPPSDDEGEEDNEDGIPADVIKQVTDLYNSNRKNRKQTRNMLAGKPFGEYDPDELLEAAGIK